MWFSGAGLLIRKLRVRVPPPEPMDGRKPLCSNGSRLGDSVDQSAVSIPIPTCGQVGSAQGRHKERRSDFADLGGEHVADVEQVQVGEGGSNAGSATSSTEPCSPTSQLDSRSPTTWPLDIGERGREPQRRVVTPVDGNEHTVVSSRRNPDAYDSAPNGRLRHSRHIPQPSNYGRLGGCAPSTVDAAANCVARQAPTRTSTPPSNCSNEPGGSPGVDGHRQSAPPMPTATTPKASPALAPSDAPGRDRPNSPGTTSINAQIVTKGRMSAAADAPKWLAISPSVL